MDVIIKTQTAEGYLTCVKLSRDLMDDPRVDADEVDEIINDIDQVYDFLKDWYEDELWYQECEWDGFDEFVRACFENPEVNVTLIGEVYE